jgi:hypothetical protein
MFNQYNKTNIYMTYDSSMLNEYIIWIGPSTPSTHAACFSSMLQVALHCATILTWYCYRFASAQLGLLERNLNESCPFVRRVVLETKIRYTLEKNHEELCGCGEILTDPVAQAVTG